MALVVKSWSVSRTPDARGCYVHLQGREAGLLGWLLALIGLSPTTEVRVTADVLEFQDSSWSGQHTRFIPLRCLTQVTYGYHKPWLTALLITLILLPFIVGIVIGPLYYYLNRQLQVGFVDTSGWSGSFAFKRSIIERKPLDAEAAREVSSIIRELIEKRVI